MSGKNLPNLKDVSRVPEELLPVLHWWQDSGPKTLAYVGAVVAIVAAGYLWVDHNRTAREGAVEALTLASTVEDYEGVVAMNTDVAPIAKLDLARSLYTAGEYDNALAVYADVLNEMDEPALRDVAVVGRICSLEALGRIDEALAAVAEAEPAILASEKPHYLAAELTLVKARLLCQKGDKAAAKAALDAILTAAEDAPLAAYKSQAERTKAMVEAYTPKSLFDKAAEATAQ
jgi:tetratricopeptide (TPR) repeat protein